MQPVFLGTQVALDDGSLAFSPVNNIAHSEPNGRHQYMQLRTASAMVRHGWGTAHSRSWEWFQAEAWSRRFVLVHHFTIMLPDVEAEPHMLLLTVLAAQAWQDLALQLLADRVHMR